ncbi:hypothetical protein GBA52_018085 [Prunus armeniaca]|nr:hypothetical protein GBA52_018085 [Prunus armeniaca]
MQMLPRRHVPKAIPSASGKIVNVSLLGNALQLDLIGFGTNGLVVQKFSATPVWQDFPRKEGWIESFGGMWCRRQELGRAVTSEGVLLEGLAAYTQPLQFGKGVWSGLELGGFGKG